MYNVQKFEQKRKAQLKREAERALRRNVRLRLKQGLIDDLPEKPKIDKRALLDDGR